MLFLGIVVVIILLSMVTTRSYQLKVMPVLLSASLPTQQKTSQMIWTVMDIFLALQVWMTQIHSVRMASCTDHRRTRHPSSDLTWLLILNLHCKCNIRYIKNRGAYIQSSWKIVYYWSVMWVICIYHSFSVHSVCVYHSGIVPSVCKSWI